MKCERHRHKLKENRTTSFPTTCIFFDVESQLRREGKLTFHTPYLVCACYVRLRRGKDQRESEEWADFTDIKDFWEWVVSKTTKRRNTYLFAHNPTYDLVAANGFNLLDQQEFKVSKFYDKGRTFILKYRGQQRSITVLNMGNYYQGSVKSIGESVGLEKLDMDFKKPTLEEALPYCRRDVEIIKKAMLKWFSFCTEYDLGSFGVTAPAQAMNSFRHRFVNHPIFIHADEAICNLERLSFYGGRTEAFYIGRVEDQVIHYLDVNSMYPYCMESQPFPHRLKAHRQSLSVEGLNQIMETYMVCAKLLIRVRDPCIPCRIGRKLIFPVGEFQTFLSTPEIQMIQDHGEILSVDEVSVYEGSYIFKKFVNFFYTERMKAQKAGDETLSTLLKLIMNSLYGKFGQKGGGWEVLGETDKPGAGFESIYDTEANKWYNIKYINGVSFQETEQVEGYNSFPAISAHVTSYARRLIYEYASKAGWPNCFYTDTDSLFVNDQGLKNLDSELSADKLGKIKQEKELTSLVIHGPKDYTFSTGARHKGIPRSSQRWENIIAPIFYQLPLREICLVLYLCRNTWRYQFWPKINTLIRKDSLGQYYNEDRIKTLKRQYTKGWIVQGGRVIPFQVRWTGRSNMILPWEETTYYQQGITLEFPEQTEWISREFG